MSELGLRAYDEESHELRVFPLPEGCPGETRLRMRGLTGASAIQLELVNGDRVCRRFEIEAADEEPFVIHLERTGDGRLEAWSRGREVLSLPPDERYAPAPPVEGGGSRAEALDLAILVDGTTRVFVQPPKPSKHKATEQQASKKQRSENPPPEPILRPLLAEEAEWRLHGDLLVEILDGLGEEVDVKSGVFAFGDHEVADLRAPGLRPAYRLYPRNGAGWKLGTLSSDGVRKRLLAIPPSSGGDFVDALADALEACVRLPWRDDARRVVLVTGDSPGFSVLHPAPPGANLLARHLDVDTQTLALHRIGVEVVTLHHATPPESRLGALDYERALLEHAAVQYRRLASRRDLAFEAAEAEAAEVVRKLFDTPQALVRGAGYGVLLESVGEHR
jgi:hypothetical protein